MDAALKAKGFRDEEGKRHTKYHLVIDGKDTGIVTFLDRHGGEYGDFLLTKVAHQLQLRRGELNELIECPLDYPSYVSLLRERNSI